jgi:hypothetical protein
MLPFCFAFEVRLRHNKAGRASRRKGRHVHKKTWQSGNAHKGRSPSQARVHYEMAVLSKMLGSRGGAEAGLWTIADRIVKRRERALTRGARKETS